MGFHVYEGGSRKLGLVLDLNHHASDDVLSLYSYMAEGGHVYIITNRYNKVLYTGVTSDLVSRIIEHRDKYYPTSFSARYNLYKLVYYRFLDSIEAAIAEEKRIKGGSRKAKIVLIESMNPEWRDLYEDIKHW